DQAVPNEHMGDGFGVVRGVLVREEPRRCDDHEAILSATIVPFAGGSIQMPSRIVATLALALLLAGCAATVRQPDEPQPGIEIPAAATGRIVVVVKGSDKAIASDDWEALRDAWRAALRTAADEA